MKFLAPSLETAKDKRTIYYDNITLTFSYVSNNSIQPIGNITIPEFHYLETFWQAHRDATINTSRVPWEQARVAVSNGSTAMFRVDLETKFRISDGLFWKSDRYDLRVGANVTVNDHGMKSVKHILRLSSASVHVSGCIRVAIIALLVLVLPILL
ncbi:uncharacterized protein LOC113352208 [Papaver somniferum]|uniref:uncharacterized protein LOC113352208 n=1 Tax=Papaver somniferum TaxID=3469 RepID=UPI000E7039A2|nr:uncharacterized protein LOC113352208 [Papaver somniferum]